MIVKTTQPAAAASGPQKKKVRRGFVLLICLVIVASLSLAAYHYSDSMLSEYRASDNSHKAVQARAFAESGIHFAAAMLSSSDNYYNALNSNPWNNPDVFRDVQVMSENGVVGRFSIIAPADLDGNGNAGDALFGVSDESGKINVNAWMKVDPTGQMLHDMLVMLPNMTEEIANSIIDWIDTDTDTRDGGAENDYYSSLTPPYRCRNGSIDSIDELLLVKGVTRDLLYGTDYNRNGTQDANSNESGTNGFDRGWSAYLTCHSREPNYDANWTPLVYLNNADLNQLYLLLTDALPEDPDMVTFIIMCRQNATSKGGATPPANAADVSSYSLDLTKKAQYSFTSMFELMTDQVSVSMKPSGGGKAMNVTYVSPMADPSKAAEIMGRVFTTCTMQDPTTAPELPARININTAPRAVIVALPGITDTDVDNIMTARPSLSSPDSTMSDNFNSPLWLVTQAQVDMSKLAALEPYLTTRTQVYRVQSVGYFENGGPSVRMEAIIDANSGRPRILMMRELTELGKGWNDQFQQQQTSP